MNRTRNRWLLYAVTVVTVVILVGNVFFASKWRHDQCEATVRAIDNSRTMWLYLIDKNPDNPETPAFKAELDRRIPPAHCEGARLVVERSSAVTDPPRSP